MSLLILILAISISIFNFIIITVYKIIDWIKKTIKLKKKEEQNLKYLHITVIKRLSLETCLDMIDICVPSALPNEKFILDLLLIA